MDNVQKQLEEYRLNVKVQGDLVKQLKEQLKVTDVSSSCLEFELQKAITELKARKKQLDQKEIELGPKNAKFDRQKLEHLLKQRFFYDQSFSIYGGVQGLYDYGPMGCATKANLLNEWRHFFIMEEQMAEVDCSILTPEAVLKASGHVERFTDYMVIDSVTKEFYRADHLIEAALGGFCDLKETCMDRKSEMKATLSQIDNLNGKDMDDIIAKYNLTAPGTSNPLSPCQKFNLMFETSIGPGGNMKAYLRPETAQGIFVNFQRLLQFNQNRLPFAAAQIGKAFRNEISPRSGLIRVREFDMAEIEHFFDDGCGSSHPKFDLLADSVYVNLFSAADQMEGRSPVNMSLREAMVDGIITNETLAYFIGRIQLFLSRVGMKDAGLRFRQHMSNEMAHYASDCWDAECLTSYGWIECVGCANRSCFDLTQHHNATGANLFAERPLSVPKRITVLECNPVKPVIGNLFKKQTKDITSKISGASNSEVAIWRSEMEEGTGSFSLIVNDITFEITSDMVTFKEYEKNVHVEEVIPSVIEPSFGIGRILYCIFEQNFQIRDEDEQRSYLTLPPRLAPYKCSILPLSRKVEFEPFIKLISKNLNRERISHRIDDTSGSIGKRYARTDQIAIPFGLTIDFDTINIAPASVTLRERDSMKQIRISVEDVSRVVSSLIENEITWSECLLKYPLFESQQTA